MATTEHLPETKRTRIAWLVLGGVAAAGVAAVVVGYLTRPPQMGADEDVFRTVDALYTAVRMKDVAKVDRCEERLNGYRAAGKLPEPSAAYLAGVIAATRDGKWAAATERLYEFMRAQRRAGRAEKPEKPRPGPTKNPR